MIETVAGLALPSLFSFRAFVPTFAAALFMRFGPELGLNGEPFMAAAGEATPSWFTSNACLWVLGLLATAELLAHRVQELRTVLSTVDQYAKPTLAALTYFGILSTQDARFAETVLGPQEASLWLALPAAVIAGLTYALATARNTIMLGLFEADENDDSGIFGLWSWGEDVFSFFGPVLFLLFPLVMLGVLAATAAAIAYLHRRAIRKEEQSKIPCESCGQAMYRSAIRCAHCAHPNPSPTRLNWLSQSTQIPATNLESHPYRLAERRRCPVCATRLSQSSAHPSCEACAHRVFADPAFVRKYDRAILARLPRVLLVSFLLSAVPVIGLIPGIIYFRLTLVAPYSRYVSAARSLALVWLIRIGLVVLISIQWIPAVGAVSVPLMALLSFVGYRNLFLKQARAGASLAPAEAGA